VLLSFVIPHTYFNPKNGKWYRGGNGGVIRVMNKSWEEIQQEMERTGWQPLL